MEFLAGRAFHLWDYSPTFSRLVIRSPQNDDDDHNIDVIFFGVSSMDVASYLGEITIQAEPFHEPYQKFLIHTHEAVYYVIAAFFQITRLHGHPFTPTFIKLEINATKLLYSSGRGNN